MKANQQRSVVCFIVKWLLVFLTQQLGMFVCLIEGIFIPSTMLHSFPTKLCICGKVLWGAGQLCFKIWDKNSSLMINWLTEEWVLCWKDNYVSLCDLSKSFSFFWDTISPCLKWEGCTILAFWKCTFSIVFERCFVEKGGPTLFFSSWKCTIQVYQWPNWLQSFHVN